MVKNSPIIKFLLEYTKNGFCDFSYTVTDNRPKFRNYSERNLDFFGFYFGMKPVKLARQLWFQIFFAAKTYGETLTREPKTTTSFMDPHYKAKQNSNRLKA